MTGITRRGFLIALCTVALLLCSGAAFAGYLDLFWDLDPESLSWGGVAVPGTLVDRPEIAYPSSLPDGGEGQVRLQWRKQKMEPAKRFRRVVGRLEEEGFGAEVIAPVSKARGRSGDGWVGLRLAGVSGEGWYHRPRVADQVIMDSTTQVAGWSYAQRVGEEWLVGGACTDNDTDVNLRGWLLDNVFEQPRGTVRLPLQTGARTLALEGRRERGTELYGARLLYQTMGADLPLTMRGTRYNISYSGNGCGGELLWRRREGDTMHFAQALFSAAAGDGEITAGNINRGENRARTQEARLVVGRQRSSARWQRRVTLGYHRRGLKWSGHADASAIPGLSGEQYYGDLNFVTQTYALAYGVRKDVGRGWSVLGAADLTYATIDLGASIERQRGIFNPPDEVLSLSDRQFTATLLLFSGGVGYRSERVEARLVAGTAVGLTTFDLSDLGDTISSSGGDSSSLTLGYVFGADCTWKF